METHWAKFETVTMYTKILDKENNEDLYNPRHRKKNITYFTNKLHRLYIRYNASTRHQFFPALSIDLIYLVNVG